jgi:hypothetical protein
MKIRVEARLCLDATFGFFPLCGGKRTKAGTGEETTQDLF